MSAGCPGSSSLTKPAFVTRQLALEDLLGIFPNLQIVVPWVFRASNQIAVMAARSSFTLVTVPLYFQSCYESYNLWRQVWCVKLTCRQMLDHVSCQNNGYFHIQYVCDPQL